MLWALQDLGRPHPLETRALCLFYASGKTTSTTRQTRSDMKSVVATKLLMHCGLSLKNEVRTKAQNLIATRPKTCDSSYSQEVFIFLTLLERVSTPQAFISSHLFGDLLEGCKGRSQEKEEEKVAGNFCFGHF